MLAEVKSQGMIFRAYSLALGVFSERVHYRDPFAYSFAEVRR